MDSCIINRSQTSGDGWLWSNERPVGCQRRARCSMGISFNATGRPLRRHTLAGPSHTPVRNSFKVVVSIGRSPARSSKRFAGNGSPVITNTGNVVFSRTGARRYERNFASMRHSVFAENSTSTATQQPSSRPGTGSWTQRSGTN